MQKLFIVLLISISFFSCNNNVTDLQSGSDLYVSNCSACHGADGKKGLANAADLSKSVLTIEEQKNIILNGKNTMAAFKYSLTDNQIDSLVTFIQTLKK